jgi:hypothetical protein
LLRKLNSTLLSAGEVDHAFPLVRTLCPAAELDGWRRFALQRLAGGPGSGTGILIVRNEQDCIVGIAAFRLADDLIHGPVLVADPFCAIDIVDQANVARTLENGLEKEARLHGCTAVHTNLPSSGSQGAEDWLVSVLYERGHRLDGLQMRKLISQGS